MVSQALPAGAVRDQGGEVNSCLSCALAAGVEAAKPDSPILSALFHYYWSRPGQSGVAGLTMLQGFAGAERRGFCFRELYDPSPSRSGLRSRPDGRAISDGRLRRFLRRGGRRAYVHLPDSSRVDGWRRALARRHPVVAGLLLDESYWEMRDGDPVWKATGPRKGSQAHAVAVLGFDDRAEHFVVQDSRGESFADGGQWYLRYRVCPSPLIEEAWALRLD